MKAAEERRRCLGNPELPLAPALPGSRRLTARTTDNMEEKVNLRRRTGGWAATIHTGMFAVVVCTGLTLALAGCSGGSANTPLGGSQTTFGTSKAMGNG